MSGDSLPEPANAGQKPPFWTRKRKIAAWICAGTTIVLLAILIPVLLLVIVPKIAQDSINSSRLTFASVSITNIKDDSYTLASTGRVENAGMFDAEITFPSAVQVFWTNRPDGAADLQIGSMSLPGFSVSGAAPKSGNVEIPGTQFAVSSVDNMSAFSKFLIAQGSFSWRLKGSAQAKALGITLKDLSLDKVVTLDGFSGLKNVTIKTFDLPESDPTKGIVINTVTNVANPSFITIELGNLEFDSYVEGSKIGSLSSKEPVKMAPGDNKINLNGHLRAIDPKDLATLGNVFSFYVGGKDTKLEVVGTKVSPPNGECKWLSAGFVGLVMRVVLAPPAEREQLVSGIKIPAIGVTFDPADPTGYSIKSTAPQINAVFKSPFNFPLNVVDAAQQLTFVDPATKTPFGTVNVPFVKAVADQKAQTLVTSFTDAPLTAVKGNEAAFQNFMKALTAGQSYTFNIDGLVSSHADTAGGRVTISNVTLADTITFQGLNGLNQVTVDKVSVIGGTVDKGIEMKIGTTITNPSSLSLDLKNDVTLTLKDAEDHVLGTVMIPLMKLVPGANSYNATSFFKPAAGVDTEKGQAVLANFLTGQDQQVKIAGSESSVIYESLKPAFSTLSITSTLPALKTQLVQSARLTSIDLSTTPSATATVSLRLSNPLDTDYIVTGLDSQVFYNGNLIGSIQQDISNAPIAVPKGQTVDSRDVNMMLGVSKESIRALVIGLDGNLTVDIRATLETRVGEYPTTLAYAQNGVKTLLG
ncbi:hypothetical protein HDU97_007233 [Phlyctochytrium planicorne]|nr:hypothetical protein HDU97_007233 [Phlyctochytrium planicorne]